MSMSQQTEVQINVHLLRKLVYDLLNLRKFEFGYLLISMKVFASLHILKYFVNNIV